MNLTLPQLTRDYGDIDGEAMACRASAALFDFSFMARGAVAGEAALAALQSLTPRPLAPLHPGGILYAVRTNARGHAVADLTIWHLGAAGYELFSGRHEDVRDLAGARDLGGDTCILALQGPASLACLAGLAPVEAVARLAYFEHAAVAVAGVPCRVGRLGYTGERGFEIVGPAPARERLWRALSARARPAGFAAADILRIEAGFVLFANELQCGVTPAEAGLVRFAAPSQEPARVVLTGFTARCAERPVLFRPRPDLAFPPSPGEIAVTSAAWSPHRDGIVGLGYVRAGTREPAPVDPTGTFSDVRIAAVPFLDADKRRVRGGWRRDDLRPDPGRSAH